MTKVSIGLGCMLVCSLVVGIALANEEMLGNHCVPHSVVAPRTGGCGPGCLAVGQPPGALPACGAFLPANVIPAECKRRAAAPKDCKDPPTKAELIEVNLWVSDCIFVLGVCKGCRGAMSDLTQEVVAEVCN